MDQWQIMEMYQNSADVVNDHYDRSAFIIKAKTKSFYY